MTKATTTLGDTVRLVAELAWGAQSPTPQPWLGPSPPWVGQAGQRAVVLWLGYFLHCGLHRQPHGVCTPPPVAQPLTGGQAERGPICVERGQVSLSPSWPFARSGVLIWVGKDL